MKDLFFVNSKGQDVNYFLWDIENPIATVVISHGMAEHALRYDALANYLNENKIKVYAISQIGHGPHAEKLGHMGKDEFNLCVSNLNDLVEQAKLENNVPVFLLGHSMGSFLSQLYIERYHNIKGCILSGSSAATPIMKVGSFIASVVYAFSKDKTKPNKFMDNMSFGSYNKPLGKVRTKFDWLNRDEAEVDKYIEDPLCGYVCSTSFFKYMTKGLAEMGKKKVLKNVDKNLPLLIHGGSMDPVSNCGKGLYALEKQYQKLGLTNVKLIVYENARHEIYNELNKNEVYENTLNFIKENL